VRLLVLGVWVDIANAVDLELKHKLRLGHAVFDPCECANDHHTTRQPERSGWANRDIRRRCDWSYRIHVSVAEERIEHRRGYIGKLYNSCHGLLRQWINFSRERH
jgi:hypothetical protein